MTDPISLARKIADQLVYSPAEGCTNECAVDWLKVRDAVAAALKDFGEAEYKRGFDQGYAHCQAHQRNQERSENQEAGEVNERCECGCKLKDHWFAGTPQEFCNGFCGTGCIKFNSAPPRKGSEGQ